MTRNARSIESAGNGEDGPGGCGVNGESGTESRRSGQGAPNPRKRYRKTRTKEIEVPLIEHTEESSNNSTQDTFKTLRDIFWAELQEVVIKHRKLRNLNRGASEMDGVPELEKAIRVEKKVRNDLLMRIRVLETKNASVLETQNASVLETQNASVLETQNASVLETQNASVLETQNASVLETQNASVLETQNASVLETQNARIPAENTDLEITLKSVQAGLTTLLNDARYHDYCTKLFVHAAHYLNLTPFECKRALDREIMSFTSDHWDLPHHVKLQQYLRTINLTREQWDLSNFCTNGSSMTHGELDNILVITRDLEAVGLLPGADESTKSMLTAVITAYLEHKMWKRTPPVT